MSQTNQHFCSNFTVEVNHLNYNVSKIKQMQFYGIKVFSHYDEC